MPSRLAHDLALRGRVSVKVVDRVLTGLPLVEAEEIAAQGGGEVRIRTDKRGVSKKATSHWDDDGHWMEWRVRAPEDGRYELVVRYCTPKVAVRKLAIDGRDMGRYAFSNTGGYGSDAQDWSHTVPSRKGAPVCLHLNAGEHIIRLENTDGQGMNLDYLALRRTK